MAPPPCRGGRDRNFSSVLTSETAYLPPGMVGLAPVVMVVIFRVCALGGGVCLLFYVLTSIQTGKDGVRGHLGQAYIH